MTSLREKVNLLSRENVRMKRQINANANANANTTNASPSSSSIPSLSSSQSPLVGIGGGSSSSNSSSSSNDAVYTHAHYTHDSSDESDRPDELVLLRAELEDLIRVKQEREDMLFSTKRQLADTLLDLDRSMKAIAG